VTTRPRVLVEDLTGVLAIMPTPATANASDPAVRDTVDHAEAARAVEQLIADGVDALLSAGTFGECASLTHDELNAFATTIVKAAARRVPVFVGATTLNTRDTIERARELADIGVDGLLLGRPMWSYLDEVDIVRYYREVAAAVPELAIIVYDNPEAFKGKIPTAAYRAFADLPQIIGVKYPSLVGANYSEDLAAAGGKVRILPIDRDWYQAWTMHPDHAVACWSGSASCGPLAHVELAKAIREGNDERAKAVNTEIQAAAKPFLPQGSFALFSNYNVQLEKIRINEAGYIAAGPCRPPYINCPEEYAAGARESARLFAELNARYAAAKA
jgi:4-(2-carboxyphenyl)-2-oxobut-3-enoate aldolase